MLVRNTAMEQKTISIVKVDGKKDTITLMPRGGNAVQLPKGARIDPDMVAEYRGWLRCNPPLTMPKPAGDAPAQS